MSDRLFRVIDNNTGKEPEFQDLGVIVVSEEWASRLIWPDVERFAVDDYGILILMDSCGNYVYPPNNRFRVERANENCVKELKAENTKLRKRVKALAKALLPFLADPWGSNEDLLYAEKVLDKWEEV